ncbi:alpha/beta hydrolase [Mesorhizobium sp. WSM4906]|uniref:alpha/beta hydrolase n=1 Tax=Mesorhizobium sp. WSM4906 TaxID=3038546 RepID=UPI002417EB79|nr:alpha/beta hydrolase [Mesorhizobium sp. WSM4906]WFP74969.1 alpha/beta hydrolase [Mesorhizobium sp. WSM4906]
MLIRYILKSDKLLFLAIASIALVLYCRPLFAREFKKTDCWFEIPQDRAMTCGTLSVPENRKKPSGNQIVLSIVIFDPDRERHEPVVFLTGGPGQPTDIADREDIDDWWEFISTQSWMIGRRVVVVDQRGIGRSAPNLGCTRYFEPDHWNSILSDVAADAGFDTFRQKELIACKTALIARGVDLDSYNTGENAEDINDLRSALGIEKWVLYGVSYGTRLALEVMNRHPEGISASILDSVVPLDINYIAEDGESLEKSLKVLERDCRKQDMCMENISKAVQLISTQLDRQPLLLRSKEKKYRYKYFSGVDFLELIFGMLYDREDILMLPELIERTYKQDYEPLAELAFEPEDLEISQGMDYSVTCSDNGRPDWSKESSKYWVKWAQSDEYSWGCPIWKDINGSTPQIRPRRTDIPTLLLSGEYDPATPTEWANRAAEALALGQVVVFRGIGHDVIDSDPCGSEVVADFLANPTRKLTTACVDRMTPPQFMSSADKQWSGGSSRRALSAMSSKQMRLPFRLGHVGSVSPE